jgi:Alginate lyase
VNPDRNQLHALSQLNTFSQSTVDNALASVLDNNQDSANNAAKFIDNFFLNSNTGMLPNLAWGQTVRGPDQHGSYMGVLDFRVMVKVANAIQILRMSRSQYWTSDRDSKMIKWSNSYIQWLDDSDLGNRAKKSVK